MEGLELSKFTATRDHRETMDPCPLSVNDKMLQGRTVASGYNMLAQQSHICRRLGQVYHPCAIWPLPYSGKRYTL